MNISGFKKISTAAVITLAAGLAFYGLQVSNAQTVPAAGGKPVFKATPTPVPSPTEGDDDEPIKIDTELVNLSVRVVDRNNKPLGSLTQNDFKVFEDNVAQPLEFFSKEEVAVNYVLLVDNSNSLRQQLDKVIEASKILVNSNRPGDETAYIRFVSSTKIEILQDFTPEREPLIERLDEMYVEAGATAVRDAVFLAAEKVQEYEKEKNDSERKRRAIILVTDGEDRDSYYKEQQLFAMLREADVQIYTIGFVGELDKESGFIRKSDQSKAMGLLNRMSQETGGKAYFPKSVTELPDIARDIASDLRTQYSIGYAPTNDRKDGSYRAIRVVVSDGPKKEKRIALTRAGRTAGSNSTTAPVLSKPLTRP